MGESVVNVSYIHHYFALHCPVHKNIHKTSVPGVTTHHIVMESFAGSPGGLQKHRAQTGQAKQV